MQMVMLTAVLVILILCSCSAVEYFKQKRRITHAISLFCNMECDDLIEQLFAHEDTQEDTKESGTTVSATIGTTERQKQKRARLAAIVAGGIQPINT